MLSILGQPQVIHDQWTRRDVLQAGGAGLLGLSLPKVLQAEAISPPREGRARSVIFLFLFGGPSQLETFDMKPDAPQEIRGPFRPIASRTPGLLMCEHLPRLAGISDKFSVVRTLTHDYNDHSGGSHYVQTGRRWHIPIGGGFSATGQDWPSIGAVVEYLDRRAPRSSRRNLPSYAVVPNWLGRLQEGGLYRRPGEYPGWLGRSFSPLTTAVNKRDLTDNPYYRSCANEELTFAIDGLDLPQAASNAAPTLLQLDRLRARQSLLQQFESERDRFFANQRHLVEHDATRRRVMAIVTSDETRRALNIRLEPESIRDLYGRHLFGQSTLMARRLIEAGTRVVTVHYDACDGYGWDSHVHSNDVRNHLLPTLDQTLTALLCDLEQRGLLDETLVVAMGEMGRTPRANANWGRDHWSTLFPAVLAGGGIRPGSVFGRSDRHAAYPLEHPVSPSDMAATIYHALGIDPHLQLPDALGRPTTIVENGRPLTELFV